jgi:para-aminobenzoate synthetase
MRTLLVDNYDSYTYNLYQLLAETYGVKPVVLRNDDPAWHTVDLDAFDGIVISPGPGRPSEPRDFGHSRAVLDGSTLPVLGVCLGHQGIGLAGGALVRLAPRPRHGHLSTVTHTGDGIFAGIPQGFTAVRYHSLCVAEPLPPELEPLAWAEDEVLMGLRHRDRPWWGVQFHPESIATEHGARLVANFRELALGSRPAPAPVPAPAAPRPPAGAPLRAQVSRLDEAIDTEAAFAALYGDSSRAYWLDGAHLADGRSRFSFLGDASGPGDDVLTYRVGDSSVIVESAGGSPRLEPGTIFEALDRRLGRPVLGASELPFDLFGGYVGYFGYELKADAGARAAHRADTPDAVWLRASRFIAVDHVAEHTYLVALAEPDSEAGGEAGGEAGTRAWIEATTRALRELPRIDDTRIEDVGDGAGADVDGTSWLVRSPERYLADIAECQNQLRAGESYEICLTNKFRLPAPPDDLDYYRKLRRSDPAPYAALLRLGELTVFSSSPERFLRVERDRTVESKPIKGTAPRDADPELDARLGNSLREDPKTYAENLMIVDLMRNDLGRMCEIGTVAVPRFMAVESYATVHQLVSTVRGRLRPDVTAVDCVRACFPGGSMTGAPKLRTMEIIDRLETEARGVYSGTLGYFGFTGTADLNIVIRTAVRWRDELTVGAGGAIVLDSDADAEYDEMMLKATAALRALPVVSAAVDSLSSER